MSDAGDAGTWHRKFAIDGNNRGWTLAEQAVRTAEEDLEMLDAAHAASFHWRCIGRLSEIVRADLLVAMVHALLGEGGTALPLARRAFDHIAEQDGPAWEVALAHAVVALAAAVAGEPAIHRNHYVEAQIRGAALTDPDDRLVFETTFRQVPRPRDRASRIPQYWVEYCLCRADAGWVRAHALYARRNSTSKGWVLNGPIECRTWQAGPGIHAVHIEAIGVRARDAVTAVLKRYGLDANWTER